MSNRDNFAGGFLLGTILGGIVGGVIGAVVATAAREEEPALPEDSKEKGKKRLLQADVKSIDAARRGLEDKIAQLNVAIDDVRRQLKSVNGSAQPPIEQSVTRDP
ncbi:MAG: hypothetical protein SFW36_18335 [Leptolyngbyaceae cyanobacterium bins.59]|nr:hypothetical protein [Leptolyngbyaceae cyanobacterium bins.59]